MTKALEVAILIGTLPLECNVFAYSNQNYGSENMFCDSYGCFDKLPPIPSF
jgi:hypothetical protein